MENPLSGDLDHILEYTHDLWDEIRGEQIFMTGGTGFFGQWFLESFLWINQRLKLNSRVTVLTRSPEIFIAKNPHLALAEAVRLLQGDIRTFSFPEGVYSHIIHAATEADSKLNIEHPLQMLDTIVVGTRHVLDFSLVCGAQKFLLTSSGAVYGKQPTEINHIQENYAGAADPLEPGSAYGEGKRVAEMLCSLYSHQFGLETKIARCFAFVGPYLPINANFAIGNFIRDGLNGGPIHIKGDGTPFRSYLYAADLMIWLWNILFRSKACRPYNVGSDEAISILTVAELVAHEMNNDRIQVEVHQKSIEPKKIERYVPSIFRAQQELGLAQTIPLRDAIRRTIQWYSVK